MSEAAASPRALNDDDIVRTAARAFERDRYLAALLSPRAARNDLVALAAFAGELARIPGFVSEPTIGEIRLQWWRDTLDAGLATGTPTGHPIADAVCRLGRRHAIAPAAFHALIDAQAERIDDLPFADMARLLDNVGRWDGALFRLAWQIAGNTRSGEAPSDAGAATESQGETATLLADAGAAYGLARILIETPADIGQGRCLLPRDLLAREGIGPHAPADRATARQLGAVAATVAEEAGRRMARIAPGFPAQARAVRLAALPAALVRPYLRLSQHPGVVTGEVPDIAPLTRVWRMWITSLTGRL